MISHFTRLQREHNHEVLVLVPPTVPPVVGAERSDWSIIRRNPVSYVRAMQQLRRVIRDYKPDVVHAHSFFAGFLVRIHCWKRVPVVYQPHAWAYSLFSGRRRSLIQMWERLAGVRTDALVVNCTDELREGQEHGVRTPGHVVGVVADTAHLRPPSADERQAAKVAVGYCSRRLVVALGRIAYQKAQDLLVRGWEEGAPRGADLVLVGGGDSERLSQLAPKEWEITIHHAGPTTDVRTWLWAADVLVIPSRYETVSLVAAESMSTGLPVVTTEFNGATEAVVAGPYGPAGAVVPLGDMKTLLGEAARRMQDRDLFGIESVNARQRALHMFDGERVYERLLEAYEDAIEHRNRRRGP